MRLAVLSLLTLLPVLAVILYTNAVERDRARNEAIEETLRLARLAASQQSRRLEDTERLLAFLAELPAIREGTDLQACQAVLANAIKEHPDYNNLRLFHMNGDFMCAARTFNPSFTQDPEALRHLPWFHRVLTSGRPALGDFAIDPPRIAIAYPIVASGAVTRILVAFISAGGLRWGSNLELSPGTTLMLLDRNRTIAATYPHVEEWIGRQAPDTLATPVMTTPLRFVETPGMDGVRRLHTTLPVVADEFETGFSVVVGAESGATFAGANRLLRRQTWLLLIVAITAMGLGFAGGELFVRRPLDILTSVTRRLASGDFAARADLRGGAPGLNELAGAINDMATSLDKRQRERDAAALALREAEEHTRFALEAARVGVWEADLAAGTVRWSPTLEALHGLPPNTLGGTLDGLLASVHPDDRANVREILVGSTPQRTDWHVTYRTEEPGGTCHWITAVGRHACDESGRPVRAAGIAIDVTHQHLLEDQLRQSQKMDAVGQLAAGIAHDFNNMLTAILGNAECVTESLPLDERGSQPIAEITSAAERAAGLTRQLLAFSRKQVLIPRVVRWGEIVDGLAPMLRSAIGETIELRTNTSDRGWIKADVGQLEQVLLNLAVNARDAMPDGGTLTIDTADITTTPDVAAGPAGPPPGSYVALTVSDTGHGMDVSTRARVFEPFFTTKPVGKGTGLGLATVYGIVTQSGGHIALTSDVGRGTTFTVYLPHTSESPEAAAPAQAVVRPCGGAETILIVEDEDIVGRFVVRVLTRSGYDVHLATRCADALEFLSRHAGPIDLLLTDVVLPDRSGRALAEAALRRHPDLRVLYMSGYTDEAIQDDLRDPAMAFIQKPFTADVLMQRVREQLDKRSVQGTPHATTQTVS